MRRAVVSRSRACRRPGHPSIAGNTESQARRRPPLPAFGALIAALAVPPAALAQSGSLPPVTVTATRVETPAFDVPASIDRIGGDTIREGRALINISESLGAVPGLQARDRQNFAQDVQISIRGFGARASFGIRGIRLYVDGVPASFPDGQGQITNVDLGSADRIEVLRGPYSALYGNSSGGVISVFTEEPTAEPTVDFSLLGGSHGTNRVGVTASGTRDALGYVLSASRFHTDGDRDHSAATRSIGNAKLNLRLDDASTLTVVANALELPEAQDPLGLTAKQFSAAPHSVDPTALQFNTRKTVGQTQGGLIYERRLDTDNTVRALLYTGHRATEQYQAIPVATQANPLHPGGVIELSSTYNGTDLRWTNRGRVADASYTLVAGLAYDRLEQQRRGNLNYVGTGTAQVLGVKGALRRDEVDTVSNLDEYLQAELKLTPAWSLSAGLRHSSVRFDSRDHYIVGTNGDDSGAVKYGATLPVLGVLYAVNEQVHLYATAGRGYETPTLNELAYTPNGGTGLNFALQPAKSDNVEAGVKTRLAAVGDLNLALFQTRTRDEIVTLTNVGGRSTYQNAGATRRTGVEVGWSQTFLENLRAQAAGTVLDATYREAFKTCNVTPCPASAQQTVPAGNRLPGIARTTAYASVAWAPPLGWHAGVEARYTSRIAADDANSAATAAAATFGADLGYVARIGAWKLTGFVRGDNLFDRRYAGSVIVNEGNGRFFEPALGRTWLVGASGNYTF